ncbi:aldo/keto reductase [Salisediminibacterium halotolerans]|uniref:aldo/keto reductase n=1 Tax=Salisediminibacterium halotolerans TaxID=517425 RepID=UPI000EB25B73|nr:aldo/keto reductase [Salisediminibacterium halotolerans]RLJ78203.1 diketogulonate reductase-like aldo/keto reductase [Actinophytocola xinjiangensis]RPE88458.1 diketogulonate reductase-like aldo/keto reductase [Salisediminibacterium halotolerans]TWG37180.1 diketogulonate reductase-like aldo/keto reductase [Salisediminibacterium halotolerans]GEL09142.1 oxidoreductase [Salisediminibacterium halotolerans]
MDIVTLNNQLKMPQIGFGVWQVPEEEAAPAVKKALETGYRSIDTAMIYRNERGVGQAIAESGIPREELFITTKVWNADQGYDNTLQAMEDSLERLGLDYVDLYLIHWPTPEYDDYVDTYKAMEKLYQDGKTKAIGVCNFDIDHIQRLLDECTVTPAVNQVECHPYLQQTELKQFLDQHNIYLEAWSPLMQGKEVLQNETIQTIAKAHNKTPAQVIIRWHLERNSIVIPKSVTPKRIEENFDVFDFSLSESEIAEINQLDNGERQGPEPKEMNVR